VDSGDDRHLLCSFASSLVMIFSFRL
jgi:hypothetical protein